MPHLTVVPFIFSIAFGSALYGYAVEPAPDMLAQISPSILSEIPLDIPADVCSVPIAPYVDSKDDAADALQECDVGFSREPGF